MQKTLVLVASRQRPYNTIKQVDFQSQVPAADLRKIWEREIFVCIMQNIATVIAICSFSVKEVI